MLIDVFGKCNKADCPLTTADLVIELQKAVEYHIMLKGHDDNMKAEVSRMILISYTIYSKQVSAAYCKGWPHIICPIPQTAHASALEGFPLSTSSHCTCNISARLLTLRMYCAVP